MSLSKQVINHPTTLSETTFEKVVLNQDLSPLSPQEKFEYIKSLALSLGLNPATKPIEIMKFQSKEIPYMRKDGTEQLRKNHKVSITNLDAKILDGGVYVVTAYASTPGGRQDSSTGVIAISGLKGDNLANAMMKAETKAKRRVTLSICGLGFIDECEVDSIPNAVKVEVVEPKQKPTNPPIEVEHEDTELDFVSFESDIKNAETIEELQEIFNVIKSTNFKSRPDLFKKLIDAKDAKKLSLMATKEFLDEYNAETGEIKS